MDIPILHFADCDVGPGDLIFHDAHDQDGNPYNRIGHAIAAYGRGWACHVALIVSPQPDVQVVEMWWPDGGRRELLRPRVEKHPGMVWWFQVPENITIWYPQETDPTIHEYDPAAAIAKAKTYIGTPYGTGELYDYWLSLHPGLSWRDLPDDDESLQYLRVCSSMVAECLQIGFGGLDPIPFLHARLCQPMDVARWVFLRMMGRIVP